MRITNSRLRQIISEEVSHVLSDGMLLMEYAPSPEHIKWAKITLDVIGQAEKTTKWKSLTLPGLLAGAAITVGVSYGMEYLKELEEEGNDEAYTDFVKQINNAVRDLEASGVTADIGAAPGEHLSGRPGYGGPVRGGATGTVPVDVEKAKDALQQLEDTLSENQGFIDWITRKKTEPAKRVVVNPDTGIFITTPQEEEKLRDDQVGCEIKVFTLYFIPGGMGGTNYSWLVEGTPEGTPPTSRWEHPHDMIQNIAGSTTPVSHIDSMTIYGSHGYRVDLEDTTVNLEALTSIETGTLAEELCEYIRYIKKLPINQYEVHIYIRVPTYGRERGGSRNLENIVWMDQPLARDPRRPGAMWQPPAEQMRLGDGAWDEEAGNNVIICPCNIR
tara:strand:+ start:176 stop:1336 length:1161 start_codon:yes stop_codon:yes gene_type:complete